MCFSMKKTCSFLQERYPNCLNYFNLILKIIFLVNNNNFNFYVRMRFLSKTRSWNVLLILEWSVKTRTIMLHVNNCFRPAHTNNETIAKKSKNLEVIFSCRWGRIYDLLSAPQIFFRFFFACWLYRILCFRLVKI